MSLERMPDFGRKGVKPVSLNVKMKAMSSSGDQDEALASGLRELFQCGEFTDVVLVCAGQKFLAHQVVLAAKSKVFREGLATTPGNIGARQEVRLADISNPEAVKCMLDYLYGMDSGVWAEYNPRTQEINKDVLRLAQNFGLSGLTDRATHWLAKNLSTGNVVERLNICDEFGLSLLREKILEQLTLNKVALAEVAHSPQIMKYPGLMQALLQQASMAPDLPTPEKKRKVAESPTPKKKSRKA